MTDDRVDRARAVGERKDQAQEIRDRRSVLEQVLQMLPPALLGRRTELLGGGNESWVLRGDKGKHLAQFYNHTLAQFTRDAVDNLKAFSAYIEQLEREAFQNRRKYRRQDRLLKEITDELYAASQFGIHTKDGQRRVRQAVEAMREDRLSPDWDDDW